MTWLGTTRIIVPWDIAVQIPIMQGSAFCCHEHFVVVSNVNNGVMTTPAANNGHDDITVLHVTSQWFGMWLHHKYALIWDPSAISNLGDLPD